MDLGINDKRALVTGASSGIGRACAIELAKEGARVCAVARNEQRLGEVVAEIAAAGGEAFFVSADLSTERGCRDAISACAERWGGIDILVNVAGAAQNAHVIDELTPAVIDDALGLKLYSYLRLSQMAFPYMAAQGWGRIVNIAGAAGTGPTSTNLPASFANVTILNLTRALSDVGVRDGILVNAICPGLTNTPRTREHRRVAAQRAGKVVDEAEIESEIARAARSLPAGRMCEPEEVARLTCFLASEACSYLQASALYMDGGARRATP
ncbi:MAG TPA: SDR family NAD(P)-dependent oxidoreductase [Dehalococcoidia bacterium]|jgi:NAD(P)-dependent dehydrogenase (short-subunit alcohol dehydrogenase family)|nr:SDR family NAD(P)-dependent oxidoreductase [Dehalococcoidia bacterium]